MSVSKLKQTLVGYECREEGEIINYLAFIAGIRTSEPALVTNRGVGAVGAPAGEQPFLALEILLSSERP